MKLIQVSIFTCILFLCTFLNADAISDIEANKAKKKENIVKVFKAESGEFIQYKLKVKNKKLKFSNSGDVIMFINSDYMNIDIDDIWKYVKFDTTVDKEITVHCEFQNDQNNEYCDYPFFTAEAAHMLGGLFSATKALTQGELAIDKKYDEAAFAQTIVKNKDFVKQAVEKAIVIMSQNKNNESLNKEFEQKITHIKKEQSEKVQKMNAQIEAQKKKLQKLKRQQQLEEKKRVAAKKKELEVQKQELARIKAEIEKQKKEQEELKKVSAKKAEIDAQQEELVRIKAEIEKQKQEQKKIKELAEQNSSKSQPSVEVKDIDTKSSEKLAPSKVTTSNISNEDKQKSLELKKQQDELQKQKDELAKIKAQIVQQKKEQLKLKKIETENAKLKQEKKELLALKAEVEADKKEQEDLQKQTLNYLLKQ